MTFKTIDEAYLACLDSLLRHPEFTDAAPRGLAIHEITDVGFRVEQSDCHPIVTHDFDRNKVIVKYLKKEMELYASMTNKVSDFVQASKFWDKIANPDGTINSAYGFLIWANNSIGGAIHSSSPKMTPWEWVLRKLQDDKHSRQAFLRFSLPEHQWMANKDQVCTMHGNFLIRDNKLQLTVVMRSCDVVKGLVYDMPWFCYIHECMRQDLVSGRQEHRGHTNPGACTDLKLGSFKLFVHSLHFYNKDIHGVRRMLGI
jgi:thymidylate synthase